MNTEEPIPGEGQELVETCQHTLQVPPATDIEALSNFIGLLLRAHLIPNNIPVVEEMELDHPIPESKQLLMQQAMELNGLLRSLHTRWSEVELIDARYTGPMMTLIFKCRGDRTNEFVSIS